MSVGRHKKKKEIASAPGSHPLIELSTNELTPLYTQVKLESFKYGAVAATFPLERA